jgi:hypothetical protein
MFLYHLSYVIWIWSGPWKRISMFPLNSQWLVGEPHIYWQTVDRCFQRFVNDVLILLFLSLYLSSSFESGMWKENELFAHNSRQQNANRNLSWMNDCSFSCFLIFSSHCDLRKNRNEFSKTRKVESVICSKTSTKWLSYRKNELIACWRSTTNMFISCYHQQFSIQLNFVKP